MMKTKTDEELKNVSKEADLVKEAAKDDAKKKKKNM